jgi:2-oxoglutarate ferredoxin oxidoreductase subunit delta
MNTKEPTLEAGEDTVIEAIPSTASQDRREEKIQPSARAEVSIFNNWCKGCGLCAAFCPQEVLKVNGDGKVHVIAPERCTACHWCDTHCPDFAIVVRRIDETPGRRRGA